MEETNVKTDAMKVGYESVFRFFNFFFQDLQTGRY